MDYRQYPVLYVDDNRSNRIVMEHTLGREFNVIITENGKQALEVLAAQHVAVLLTDHRMPEMTGVDLAQRVYTDHPDVVRVIITAYSDIEITVDAINRGRVNSFLKKPWTYDELLAVVRESINTYHTSHLVKQMQEKLLGIDRTTTLGILATGIAHDLKQPLTHILPFIGLAKENLYELESLQTEGKVSELIAQLRRVVDEAAMGAEMLRLFANSLTDQVANRPISMETVDLREIAENALCLVRMMVTQRARIEVDLPTEPVEIVGCPSRLSQLCVNLLINAAQSIEPKASRYNWVTLRLKSAGDKVIVEVEDTGQGISEADQERIFTPFFSTKDSADGSGLGLAICKQAVDAHRGTIEVASTIGDGTRFTVTLPKEPNPSV